METPGKGRLLIVDDDRGIALLERRALSRAGYSVVAVGSPDAALESLRSQSFDLVIVDYQLGGPVSGLELYRRLHEDWPELPAIMVTGFSDEVKAIEALRAGVRDIVPKIGDYLDRLPYAVERVLNLLQAERQLAEAKTLRESEERFRELAEAMPQLVWIANPDGFPTYVNRRWREYTGQSLDEACSPRWTGAIHAEDAQEADARWQASRRSGDPFDFEYRLRKHDGSHRWFLCRAIPVRDGEGAIVHWLGTCTDIDDKKRNEGDLHRTKEVAEAANRAKDHFLAVLSHELRTPLTPVLTAVELLEMRPELPAELRDPLAMIRRNVELEARLIDDLLDLTSIARGKLELKLQALDVHESFRQALEICGHDLQNRNLDTVLELTASRTEVRADPARLQQVFWNLVKNAIKFTPSGGRILMRTRDGAEGRVVVEVIDNGIGIASEVLPRLFDAFEQGGQGITRLFGGLGLGLAISKALIELHDGTIRAASAGANQGATFTVELPAEAPAPSIETPALVSSASSGQSSLRILLVEDHADTRDALAELLMVLGHDVTTAGTVAAALEAERESGPFDLLLSDLGLPDGSGHDLMRAIRSHDRPAPPGVCLTGFGMEDDIRMSREAGFAAHLVKPVDLRELRAVLARFARE